LLHRLRKQTSSEGRLTGQGAAEVSGAWAGLTGKRAALAAYGLPVEPVLSTCRTAHPGATAGDLFGDDTADYLFQFKSLFGWIGPETEVQPQKCSGFRTAGCDGSCASANDHQSAKVT